MSTWSEENERLRMELRAEKKAHRDATEQRDAYLHQLEDARASLHLVAEAVNDAIDRVQPLIFGSMLQANAITTDLLTFTPGHQKPGTLIKIFALDHNELSEPVNAVQLPDLTWQILEGEDAETTTSSRRITSWRDLEVVDRNDD